MQEEYIKHILLKYFLYILYDHNDNNDDLLN